MIFLFVHQNFPAQYRHLVRHLAEQPENKIYFISQPNGNHIEGVEKITYERNAGGLAACHPLTADIDEAIRTGAAVTEVCRLLKDHRVQPDIIVGHNGWGETLFVKDIFPDVPLLAYFEFYYRFRGADVEFDPEFDLVFSDPLRFRTRNAVNLMGFEAADWGHTATRWQRGLYPPDMQNRITTLHEGVDTDFVIPDPAAWVKLSREELVLTRQDEVVTYVSRNLEPYRGFHIFMRALPEILRRRPRAHVVIVGGDDVSYGSRPVPGTTYREMMLREVGARLDFTRVHFVGQIGYTTYLKLLQVSSVHVYLTYPFVLSWSFIEALSAGCLVVGSATPPVLEVLKDRLNGLVVDFFSPSGLADRIDEVLDHPDRMQTLRHRARQTAVDHFDLKRRQLALWEELLDDVMHGRRPDRDRAPPILDRDVTGPLARA